MNNCESIKINDILIAGFGGQGILFAGKLLAYFGLIDGKEVSWLPSYGPAMRGGTCNCSVCISDEPIGSPLILEPDTLIVMNTPSYDKFISALKPGGNVYADSTLIHLGENKRNDVNYHTIPATQLAADNGIKGMANIIMLGKLLQVTGFTSIETVKKAMEKVVPVSKKDLIEINLKAIEIGREYC